MSGDNRIRVSLVFQGAPAGLENLLYALQQSASAPDLDVATMPGGAGGYTDEASSCCVACQRKRNYAAGVEGYYVVLRDNMGGPHFLYHSITRPSAIRFIRREIGRIDVQAIDLLRVENARARQEDFSDAYVDEMVAISVGVA